MKKKTIVNTVLKRLSIVTAAVLLASCLKSNELLIDEAALADPFGHDFTMSYANSQYLVPKGQWFETMSSNGQVVQVGFVATEFLKESDQFSYWITVFRFDDSYHYGLMRFNKTERSAYVCRPDNQSVDSRQALYEAMADEYRDLLRDGVQDNCGTPAFVREAPAVPVREPFPAGPLTADDKIRFIQEMIETAEVGRKRDRNNLAYEYLSRGGVLQECRGPFIGRITNSRKDETVESSMSLVMVYTGEPSKTGEHEEDFNACALGLRKMEYLLMENAAMSMGMLVPAELEPSRLLVFDRDYKVLLDSDEVAD